MIFKSGPSRLLFTLLIILALSIAALDLSSDKFREGKAYLNLVATPLQWLVDLPVKMAGGVSDVVVSRATLIAENDLLRTEAIVLEQKVLQNATLSSENRRLRTLLNARQKVEEEVQMAELIGVSSDPFQHEILINRGEQDGLVIGQPALDSGGIMGLVVDLAPVTSRVMLVTDSRSSVPVQVLRTGFRTLALGSGSTTELKLDHIPNTEDIRLGDLLVSSGLGGVFPMGYPVAEITEFRQEPGRSFAVVRAKPTAAIDKSRYLLLVQKENQLKRFESE